MATVVLAAAGQAAGNAIGGTIAGVSAATLGQAFGAVAGGLIDQQIMGGGSRTVETGRVNALRLQGSTEGAPIPRVYGRMRVPGQVIWSSKFLETVRESSAGGGKGAPSSGKVREFSYSVSFAIALCEGPIERIGRVWADGKAFSLEDADVTLHKGGDDQVADKVIELIEGTGQTPAYRGIAYLVFDNLDLAPFGNRLPQFNVEVFRRAQPPAGSQSPEETAPELDALVRGVALSPGSGEFSISTDRVRAVYGEGESKFLNVNSIHDAPDLVVAMDQLETDVASCETVSLIVSWFGDDLRCGDCQIYPAVEDASKVTEPHAWTVSGVGRASAPLVSTGAGGRPSYGGTPSDQSVIQAIREIRARRGGTMGVMFYPFILMDVPPGNDLQNPWSGDTGQPVFPWRGRITLSAAPGQPGSPDKSAAALSEVDAFFGQAQPEDFTQTATGVEYSGPEEWSFRRFILHYANLCVVAGGVESFCIGSELRSLTQIRSGPDAFPVVEHLRALAAEVKAILDVIILDEDTQARPKIGYAADWSEYFGYQPGDGSGDVFFHLDPLWADPAIDFVGVDNYLPMSDWRDEDGHLDQAAGAASIYSLSYLKGNVEGGEGYDWYYASDADRAAQVRTPIVDGAHGEDWIYRPKDLRNWWSNPHHNRPGGVRDATPTAWMPESKPFWFTEIGCAAMDKGSNQPNIFYNPQSSEGGLPHFSTGVRDDEMQRRFLQAALGYWEDAANNPISSEYSGPMIDTANTYVWTWDARPWPDFPGREVVWSDGPAYELGHWISGRLGGAPLADIVAEICAESGLEGVDVSDLARQVDGFSQERVQTGRDALQQLMLAFGFDAVESNGALRFKPRGRPVDATLDPERFVTSDDDDADGPVQLSRTSESELPETVQLGFVQSNADYLAGASTSRAPVASSRRVERSELAIALSESEAQRVADRWTSEAWVGRNAVSFTLPPSMLACEPGDVIIIPGAPGGGEFRIDAIEEAGSRQVRATLTERQIYRRTSAPERSVAPPLPAPAAPVSALFLDLPLLRGDEDPANPRIAAFARPWPGEVAVYDTSIADGFVLRGLVTSPAGLGRTENDLVRSEPNVWTRGVSLYVTISGEGPFSRTELAVLNGANAAAIMTPSGEWEILQYRDVEPEGEGVYRLSGLLRGQAGTEPFIGDPTPAGARFVLLNDAIGQFDLPPPLQNLSRSYRFGPSNAAPDHDSYLETDFTYRKVACRPYAPAHLKAVRNSDGDREITWIRRSRTDGDSWSAEEIPLSEELERYRLQIVSGGVVVRTIETQTPAAIYTAADHAEDGSPSDYEITVAQISSTFGAGPEQRILIND